MKIKLLLAALAAAVVAGVAVTVSVAASPNPGDLKIAPAGLGFGYVQIGETAIKSVTITNKTGSTLYYKGADWPNGVYPGIGESGSLQPFPLGFWEVDPTNIANTAPFPSECWTLAPGATCTLYFGFTPFETGRHQATFDITYAPGHWDASGNWVWDEPSYPSNTVHLNGVGLDKTTG